MKALRWVRRHFPLILGGTVLFCLVAAALLAPYLAPHDPTKLNVRARLQPPSFEKGYILGSDEYGLGYLFRLIYGARVSLGVGVAAVTMATAAGTLVGTMAGYHRGWVDRIVMRVMDGMMAFPSLLLAIGFAAVLGQGLKSVIIALGIVFTPRMALVVRAATLRVAPLEYVAAAKALGASHARIVFAHVLPNVLSAIIVQATLTFAYVLLSEASLSFLGLGAAPPTPTWGSILYDGQAYLANAPWITLFPGLAISVSVLALNLLSDGLRDAFDPRKD